MASVEELNKAIEVIKNHCKSFRKNGKDCYRDYCPFGTNCPSEIGDVPPSDWEKVEEKSNDWDKYMENKDGNY